jgi:hypothetical protein
MGGRSGAGEGKPYADRCPLRLLHRRSVGRHSCRAVTLHARCTSGTVHPVTRLALRWATDALGGSFRRAAACPVTRGRDCGCIPAGEARRGPTCSPSRGRAAALWPVRRGLALVPRAGKADRTPWLSWSTVAACRIYRPCLSCGDRTSFVGRASCASCWRSGAPTSWSRVSARASCCSGR